MSKYSKAEQQVMAAAFKHLFNASDNAIKAPAIQKWMENAAIGIVEYDSRFKNEGNREKDQRMEIVEVYDGDISTLVSHLRRTFKEYRNLTKWELVFTLYNEIMAAQKAIEQAMLEITFGGNEATGEVPQETEELQNNPSASTEDVNATMDKHEETTSEPVQEIVQSQETSNEDVTEETPITEVAHVEEHVEESIDRTASSESYEKPLTEQKDIKPSGNVQETEVQPLFNKQIDSDNKEEKSMSEIDELLNAAKSAAPTAEANPAEAQKVPGSANVAASKAADKEAKTRVAELLAGQKEQRNAWTRGNVVTAIISTQKPAALRVLGQMGVPVKDETDATKALEEINKKIDKFIYNVSGRDGITQDAFEALSDEEKFANVVVKAGVDNIGKARAMYNLYKQIKQNPLAEVAAFIPTTVNYPTRGYMIGETPYPEQEFILQLIDNGNGVLYGEGSMDANGNDVGDAPVIFKVGIATRTEKAKSTGVSTGKKTNKVPVVRPLHKKEFVGDPDHIKFLFTQEDTEAKATGSFKAAINVGNELMAATVSCYALENGQKVQRSVKEDGTVTYKTKVASINVSVPVTKIKKEFAANFRTEGEDILVTAGRWNVQMSAEKQKGNFGNIVEFSASPALDVFAAVYAGNIVMSDTLRAGSESIKMLQAAANSQAEADAAASADELV